MRLAPHAVTIAALFGLGSACAAAKPAPGTYSIDFPSVAAAVNADTVQVFVFDAPAVDTCQTLFEARKTGGQLPTPLFTSDAASPCTLEGGKGSLNVSYGNRAFLAVAQKSPSAGAPPVDFLLGCATQAISSSSTVVVVPMVLANGTVQAPTTTCQTLSQHCAGGC